jgi:hypothetical protein
MANSWMKPHSSAHQARRRHNSQQRRACLAGLRLLKKRLRLWLFRWSGFFDGVESVLENVWENGFTSWIDVVKCLNYPSLYFFFFLLFYFPFLPFFFGNTMHRMQTNLTWAHSHLILSPGCNHEHHSHLLHLWLCGRACRCAAEELPGSIGAAVASRCGRRQLACAEQWGTTTGRARGVGLGQQRAPGACPRITGKLRRRSCSVNVGARAARFLLCRNLSPVPRAPGGRRVPHAASSLHRHRMPARASGAKPVKGLLEPDEASVLRLRVG